MCVAEGIVSGEGLGCEGMLRVGVCARQSVNGCVCVCEIECESGRWT